MAFRGILYTAPMIFTRAVAMANMAVPCKKF